MLRAMTVTSSRITTSFASDADGYMTSRYPSWKSFSRVEPAWDSSHCCAVRWKLKLSAGGANLPKSECARPTPTPQQSETLKKQKTQVSEPKSRGQEHGGRAKLVNRIQVPGIGSQTHRSDQCGLVAESAEPENPASALQSDAQGLQLCSRIQEPRPGC